MIVALFGRQRTRLGEYAVRDSHLADIVEKSAASDVPEQAFVDSHRARNRDRESGHSLAVAFRLRVFGVQRAAQRLERVVVGLLEVLQRNRKLLRALRHQMFEIALIRAVLEHEAAMLQGAPDAQVQLVFLERLQNVVVRPGSESLRERSKCRAWR